MKWSADKGLPHSEILSWDETDRAKLTAYLIEQSLKCQMCGTAEWEWSENRSAYHPEMQICQGCMHLEAAREEQTEKHPGTSIVLVPGAMATTFTAPRRPT